MAFNKIWEGSISTAYGTGTNWRPNSVRNSSYAWTASGSGTGEYYLRTAANGNPGITSQPAQVIINGSAATEGTAGSLTAGQWDYADNDTLGYSTIYVRVGADPDSLAIDYIKFRDEPTATDNVTIHVDGEGEIAGSDQSATAINRFVIEEAWGGAIGSADTFLHIDPDYLEIGSGEGYISIGAAAIEVAVRGTNIASPGQRAFTIRGTAITSYDQQGGSVELPSGAAATTGSISNGTLLIASGASVADLNAHGGTVEFIGSGDTVTVYSGEVWLYGTLTGEVIQWGGTIHYMDGTLPAVRQYGGIFDERSSGLARTISEFRFFGGDHRRNWEVVTHSDYDLGRSLNVSGGG